MILNELKEKLVDELNNLWEKVEESSVYNTIKEKYDELDPNIQKYIKIGSGILLGLFILSLPFSWINQASDNINSFERNKKVLSDLLKLQKQKANAPEIPTPSSVSFLKNRIQSVLDKAALTKEQIGEVREFSPKSPEGTEVIPQRGLEQGVFVELKKLNLEQIIDFGLSLKKTSQISKLASIEIKANNEDDHYFDVNFKVTEYLIESSSEEPTPAKKRNRK